MKLNYLFPKVHCKISIGIKLKGTNLGPLASRQQNMYIFFSGICMKFSMGTTIQKPAVKLYAPQTSPKFHNHGCKHFTVFGICAS